jgi:FtsH-binding integral membrane protein
MEYQSQQNMFEQQSRELLLARVSFMSNVYLWMMIGVLMTAITALAAATFEPVVEMLHTPVGFWGVLIIQLLFGLSLGRLITATKLETARWLFAAYSVVVGLSMSVILPFYKAPQLLSAFGITIAAFAVLSVYGRVTKKDLSAVSNFCVMGLFGLVATGLLSILFPELFGSKFMMIYNLAGLLVFAGLTAYDTQKLKDLCDATLMGGEEHKNNSMIGAFVLYLDFINLFLFILRLLGRRR